jgi:magnesium chelatase family protein
MELSMNPCPYGYHNEPDKECICSLMNVLRYQKRISGPLLDRIDTHIGVPRVDYEKLSGDRLSETSEDSRTCRVCARAAERAVCEDNAAMQRRHGLAEVRQHCAIDDASKSLLPCGDAADANERAHSIAS